MADPSSKKLLLLISSLSLLLASAAPRDPAIGVTYRPSISGLPARERVVVALRSAGATHVLLPDPDPATLRAFLYSGISLLLSLPNSLLPALASNRSTARRWLSEHVLPFHPRARVAAISAGHAVLSSSSSSPDLASSLLPAIQNLRSACLHLGLREISISTTHSFEILDPALPASAARFRESLAEPYVRPLLDFLSATGSPFLIDLHPYELYRTDPAIPIGYALFEQAAFGFREDPGSRLRYRNLFDAMADAAIAAVEAMGYRELPIVVTGTGWPSGGGPREATVGYAWRYNHGLVEHLRSGLGTPMRREGVAAVYVYELFDGPTRRAEEYWGIWWANLSSKYEIVFSGSGGGVGDGGLGTVALGLCSLVLVLLPF